MNDEDVNDIDEQPVTDSVGPDDAQTAPSADLAEEVDATDTTTDSAEWADEEDAEPVADDEAAAEVESTDPAWADESAEESGEVADPDWADDESAEESGEAADPDWADDESADDSGEALWTDAESGDVPSAPAGRDPLVRVLVVTAMSLVVVLLITTVSFYLYMRMLNHAPRTVSEQAVASAEMAVKETPKNVQAWVRLAYAYASAGDVDEALSCAAKGEKVQNGEALLVVRADVLRLAKRYKEAIRAYDRALSKAKELEERLGAERAKVGVFKDDRGTLFFSVYWGRALARQGNGDLKGAVKDFELAIKENPRQTDVWVALGKLYEESGQTAKAKKAYNEALKYVPDLEAAQQGLKRLGEEK